MKLEPVLPHPGCEIAASEETWRGEEQAALYTVAPVVTKNAQVGIQRGEDMRGWLAAKQGDPPLHPLQRGVADVPTLVRGVVLERPLPHHFPFRVGSWVGNHECSEAPHYWQTGRTVQP